MQPKQVMPWTNIVRVQDPATAPSPIPLPVPYGPGPAVLPYPPHQAGFPTGNLYIYIWESPYFDLRPDLKSVSGQPKEGVPIWDKGARLFVHLGSTATVDPTTSSPVTPAVPTYLHQLQFFAWSRELYNPNSLDRGEQLPPAVPGFPVGAGPFVNITSTLFPSTPFLQLGQSEAVFTPPGTSSGGGKGHPIRYWKVVVQFWQFRPALGGFPAVSAIDPMPTYLQAGMY